MESLRDSGSYPFRSTLIRMNARRKNHSRPSVILSTACSYGFFIGDGKYLLRENLAKAFRCRGRQPGPLPVNGTSYRSELTDGANSPSSKPKETVQRPRSGFSRGI